MSSQPLLEVTALVESDPAHGYAGLSTVHPGAECAKVKGVVTMVPSAGLRARWVYLRVRKVETVMGGSQVTNVGQPFSLWTASGSWEVVPSVERNFSIELPHDIPPTMHHQKGEIEYELVATLGTVRRSSWSWWLPYFDEAEAEQTFVIQSLTVVGHQTHSILSRYLEPLSEDTESGGYSLTMSILRTAYGPDETIGTRCTVHNNSGQEMSVRHFIISLDEHFDDRRIRQQLHLTIPSPPIQTTTCVRKEVPVLLDASAAPGESTVAELSIRVPPESRLMTVDSLEGLQVSFSVRGEVVMTSGTTLSVSMPIVVSSWSREESQDFIKRLDDQYNLSENRNRRPWESRRDQTLDFMPMDAKEIPAMEPLLGLLKAIGQAAPHATRNKQMIYGILLKCRDVCGYIQDLAESTENGVAEGNWFAAYAEYTQLIESLESVLLQLAELIPEECAPFSYGGMGHTWSERREKLLSISSILDTEPFPPRQQSSASDTYFDDCCWISLLLREVIVPKVNAPKPEVTSAEIYIPGIVTCLLRLEDQLTSGSSAYPRQLVLNMVMTIAYMVWGQCSPDLWQQAGLAANPIEDKDPNDVSESLIKYIESKWERLAGAAAIKIHYSTGAEGGTSFPGSIHPLRGGENRSSARVEEGRWFRQDGTAARVSMKYIPIRGVQTASRLKRVVDQVMEPWLKGTETFVLPVYGFPESDPQTLLIVSQWCQNGNIQQYLSQRPETNLYSKLVMLWQVGGAITVLHGREPPVAHGSLKSQNVLITDSGEAALCDYGILPLLAMADDTYSMRLQPGVMVDMDERDAWLKVDLASYGTLILEVISGRDQAWITSTIRAVQRSKENPRDCPDLPSYHGLWEVLRGCWSPDPTELVKILGELAEALERAREQLATPGASGSSAR